MSPKYSKSRDIDFFNTLNEEVVTFQEKGSVFIQGDLNARTGSEVDFVQSGKRHDTLEVEEMDGDDDSSSINCLNVRNSEDKTVNARGKELLDLCKFRKLAIVNGRKPGDIFGKYTCHNWNGSSVVDYFLSSIPSLSCISSFIVGECIPWLSDHCIIKTTFLLKNELSVSTTSEELSETHPGFLWNETAISNYKTNLASDSAKEKARELINLENTSTTDLAGSICESMLESVTNVKVKTKKTSRGFERIR